MGVLIGFFFLLLSLMCFYLFYKVDVLHQQIESNRVEQETTYMILHEKIDELQGEMKELTGDEPEEP